MDVLVLAYAGCSTCKNALRWLDQHGVKYKLRPIVDEPPTSAELKKWIPASDVGVRKWLNTSGQSYRALGKDKIDAMSDAEVSRALSEDGKLVKRPVLVAVLETGNRVVVGFKPEVYKECFERR